MTTRGTSMLIPPNIVLYHSVFFLNQRRGARLVTPPPLIQEGLSLLSSIRATWSWKEVDRASRACEDCS